MNEKNKIVKVLLVDDESDLVEMLALRLSIESCDVETAFDGGDALEKVENFKPDLVVLDLVMPVMDGWEVLKKMKENPDTKDIQVVIATAAVAKDMEEKALELGAHSVLLKPFDEKELIRLIQMKRKQLK